VLCEFGDEAYSSLHNVKIAFDCLGAVEGLLGTAGEVLQCAPHFVLAMTVS
jgi:hypothetical protein